MRVCSSSGKGFCSAGAWRRTDACVATSRKCATTGEGATSARISTRPVSRNRRASKIRTSVPTANPSRKVFTFISPTRLPVGRLAGGFVSVRRPRVCRSFGCDGKIECLNGLWIPEDVDGRDLVVGKGETKHTKDAASGGDDDANISVDENRACCASASGGLDAFFGPGGGAARFSWHAWNCGGFVETNGEGGIENRDERVEIGGAKSGDKFINELALMRELSPGCWRCALDAAARAAGELARGFGSAADDFGD